MLAPKFELDFWQLNGYIQPVILESVFFEFSMIATIRWEDKHLKILDQTKLPHDEEYRQIDRLEDLLTAIRTLQIRGAPALGIAGAFGMYIGIRGFQSDNRALFIEHARSVAVKISDSRPTAINLSWGVNKILNVISENDSSVDELKSLALSTAQRIFESDIKSCRDIATNGYHLIPSHASTLTHCNTGGLATGGVGTALGVIIRAHQSGKDVHVFVDETRPLLQGARLTTWELAKEGVRHTLICDNMAGYLMQLGRIQCAIVGADRIAANGDVANKIGTYPIAVLCNQHHIPFYVAAPVSTIDPRTKSGKEIPIENRDGREITEVRGTSVAPLNTVTYNPAFDITPASLVSAIITDKKVFTGPRYQFDEILN